MRDLYAVYNGWHANEPVHVLCMAIDPEDALDQARVLLKEEAERYNASSVGKRNPHGERYWTDLRVELVKLPQVSEGAPVGTEVTPHETPGGGDA